MLLYSGIVTNKLKETKEFYTKLFNFGIVFENEWFLILHTPGNPTNEIAFLLPDMPQQNEIFRKPYSGSGAWVTIEVENVDALYNTFKQEGIDIVVDIRDEEWGERHFSVVDPNGLALDIVTRKNSGDE